MFATNYRLCRHVSHSYWYDVRKKAKKQLLIDLVTAGKKIAVPSHDDVIKAKSIDIEDVFLLGIFLLPVEEAKGYLKLYQDIPNAYLMSDVLGTLPEYLVHIKQWVTADDIAAIHKVPIGTNYGYRQALIIMVENDLTPTQATYRLTEVLPWD